MYSVSELLRFIRVSLCLKVGSNLVGKAVSIRSTKGFNNMKKGAISYWSCHYVFSYRLRIRELNMIGCHASELFLFCGSSLKSLFCSVSIFGKSIRIGIALISSSMVVVICIGIASVYS